MRMMPLVRSFKLGRVPTPGEQAAYKQEQLSKTKEQKAAERRQQEQEAREAELECRKRERQFWKEWKASDDFRLLASRLGVGGLFAAGSTVYAFGQYVRDVDALDNWRLSKSSKARLESTMLRNIPIIMIDVPGSIWRESVRDVIAHEIGHHIDHVANPEIEFDSKIATKRFHAAFENAGLMTNGSDGEKYSEHIAETIGSYLRGHELSAVLLAEVDKVLAKFPRPKVRLIKEFRRSQIARNKRAA